MVRINKDQKNFMKNTFTYFFYSLISKYPTPVNLNYNYNFGVLALLALAIQIFTGILAVMFYSNNVSLSYDSIIRLMTEIENGWLLRYVHANMASFFFIVIFLHIGRGIFYGSYKKPRSALWYSGIIILLLLIITAFLGYTLPWGQMSFWGATVITNFVSILPFIGSEALQWIWGGFSVSNPTLGKFFSLHYLLPFILFCFVVLHLYSLHKTGSSNPLGHAYHSDKIFFTPYYTQKDFLSVFIFLFAFTIICGQYPNYLGHSDNWIRANNLVTPTHIVPEWYFLLFYAILRGIPDKTAGVIFLLLSIITLIFFDTRTKIKNSRISTKKVSTLIFFAVALILTNIGAKTLNTELTHYLIYGIIFIYFSIMLFGLDMKKYDLNNIIDKFILIFLFVSVIGSYILFTLVIFLYLFKLPFPFTLPYPF